MSKIALRLKMAGTVGFEPTHGGIKTRCLTAWRRPKSNQLLFISGNTEVSIHFKNFFSQFSKLIAVMAGKL